MKVIKLSAGRHLVGMMDIMGAQNTPIYLQLQWFDTVESTKVSSELRNKRWSTEITARDKMFLNKLGITQD